MLLTNEPYCKVLLIFSLSQVDQDTVFADGSEFVSYKRVLAEMGEPYSDGVQLASLHSLSSGIMGESVFKIIIPYIRDNKTKWTW